ncbi:hypothetical protein QN277_019294 [Acacia crassicarpa]|uniref:Uncharacterized protein n=1 Tax=Acacia crassicarpa TaxID=499986 RepID=A0AAE1JVD9_9FABA|nr:hypothetical protein QN277_019294 [Acacia crassicarpa]
MKCYEEFALGLHYKYGTRCPLPADRRLKTRVPCPTCLCFLADTRYLVPDVSGPQGHRKRCRLSSYNFDADLMIILQDNS